MIQTEQERENKLKVLAIVGSLRRDSWNRKLLSLAVENLKQRGVEVEEFDLTPVPMFNPDVEALGTPERAAALHDAIVNADAVVIASPEYNGSMSAAIKNALEWASRPPNALDNKVFFVMGTGPGRTGGSRMYTQLSFALEAEGAWVIPRPRVLLPNIGQIISPEGELIDESVGELLDQAMGTFLETARRLGRAD